MRLSLAPAFSFLLLFGALFPFAGSAKLKVVKLDNPRDTMRSFMEAMQDYKEGVLADDPDKQRRIHDAVRTLDLSEIPALLRSDKGREAAILLKETIDRVIVIDYELIPETNPDGSPILRWRLKDTEVSIHLMESGNRRGQYLFTPGSVENAQRFYEQVKDDPFLEGSGGGAAYRKPWLERISPPWMQERILGFAKWQWLGLGASIFFGFVIKLFGGLIVGVASFFARRTRTDWDDKILKAIERPFSWVLLGAFWIFSIYALQFEGLPFLIVRIIGQIVASIGLIWIFYRLCDVLIAVIEAAMKRSRVRIDEHLIPLLRSTLKTLVAVLGILVAIQNLGINVASLIAGLGLGGLAFALAAKDTAANFFGSITVFIDRPFKVGEWIKVGAQEGTVEKIGFRSTRIRTFYNSEISVPNSTIANSEVDNMGRRKFRRVYVKLGVTYDTPVSKMKQFVAGIRKILDDNPAVRNDNYHVYFNDYGDFSLQVMLYFFLEVPDWATELKEREAVFMRVYELAEELGVEFAFPTQTLHLEQGGAGKQPS